MTSSEYKDRADSQIDKASSTSNNLGQNSDHNTINSASISTKSSALNFKAEIREIVSFLKTLAVFGVCIGFLSASVVQAFKIPSGSMIPTLKIGDHIFVSKFSYGLRLPFVEHTVFQWSQPKRGDVVVFTRPDDPTTLEENESNTNIIKRVVGLPGDLVEVKGSRVYINNSYLGEDYAIWEDGGSPTGNFAPERVPAGRIFLMGDNRDQSKDSRFWSDPFLEISRVKGRAIIIYWTWDSAFFSRLGKIIR